MGLCTDCKSHDVYQLDGAIDTMTLWGEFLPTLGAKTTSAKVIPFVCATCGVVKFYATAEGVANLSTSKRWKRAR